VLVPFVVIGASVGRGVVEERGDMGLCGEYGRANWYPERWCEGRTVAFGIGIG